MQIFKLLETPPVSLRDSCSIYQILSGIFGSQCSPVRKIFDLDRTRDLFSPIAISNLITNEYSSSFLTSSNKSPDSPSVYTFIYLYLLICTPYFSRFSRLSLRSSLSLLSFLLSRTSITGKSL